MNSATAQLGHRRVPLAGKQCSVATSDKVFLSLRTNEAKVAKEQAPFALNAVYESLGQPPRTLGRAEVRALAGEVYKQAVHEIDHDDAIADEVETYRDSLAEATAYHLSEGASEKIAEIEAAIECPASERCSPGG